MSFLEAQIASQGNANAYLAGVSTTRTSPVMATDPLAGGDGATVLLEVLERIIRDQQKFRDKITDWQCNLEINLDPRQAEKGLGMVPKVQRGGGIR